jgi:hypothetical protein
MKHINELVGSLSHFLNWDKRRIECAGQIILAMISQKTVSLVHLVFGFRSKAQSESIYKRLKRFLAYDFDLSTIVPMVLSFFALTDKITLIMDRTNWKWGRSNINILFLSVAYKGIGIPIFWMTMNKAGNSNVDERIKVMKMVIRKVGVNRIENFVADREFIGKQWLRFLLEQKIPFVIRVRNDALIEGIMSAQVLFRKIEKGAKTAANRRVMLWGELLYVSGSRSPDGELMVLVSNRYHRCPQSVYKKRWEIEVMFQCMKGRGFNLEETRITDAQKIDRLIFLLSIAFCWMYKTGDKKSQEKPIELKKHGRKAKSIFRYGLDEICSFLANLRRYTKRLCRAISVAFDCESIGCAC